MRIPAIIVFIFISVSIVYSSDDISERLDKAIRLSWDKKYEESVHILRDILNKDPGNLRARIQLARVLSWMGNLEEALKECDTILKDYPDNPDVLLTKANILRWNGNNLMALRIYKNLLKRTDDFDTRLALTYAIMGTGDIKGSMESMEKLKISFPYQEKEYNELKKIMDEKKGPSHSLSGGYTYYSDSDDNRSNRYDIRYNFSLMNLKTGMNYIHINAEDNIRNESADVLNLRSYYRLNENVGAGFNGGIASLGGSNYLTGGANLDVLIPYGELRIYLSREPLFETAELIEKKIRYNRYGLGLYLNFLTGFNISSNFDFRDYSDNNSAIDTQLNITRTIYKKEHISIRGGYRFRFMDYRRQSYGGYFDPDNFLSHQIIMPIYYETGRIYLNAEPYLGIQRYSRYGEIHNDIISGGYLSFGYNIQKGLSIELNLEGGNYGATTQAGWRYYLIGLRLVLKPSRY